MEKIYSRNKNDSERKKTSKTKKLKLWTTKKLK